ncbi:MAG: hypothetical protein Q7U40_01110 [Desulfatirhabdiaceae bacterium]|nr:hypothetical protein [Desulfatirhabdiaceae bacterium]
MGYRFQEILSENNKAAYAYVLTPQGIDDKLHLLMQFVSNEIVSKT